MKRKSIILSCVMVFCLMAGVFSANAAYDIALEATDGATAQDTFDPLDTYMYLNINLAADSGGVAGCAFTLTYPADKLEIENPTNPGNLPDSASTPDITSIFPFMTAEKYTRCENSSEAGKIMFAGAEIDENGGSKFHYYDTTLFTVKFKMISSGTVDFELMQTTLTNADAGWNGEGVPVVVGALPNTDPNFGGDLTDDFPILLSNFAVNPALTVTISGDNPYEDWKAANSYDIGGPMEDDDHDGLTNGEEFNDGNNSSDPTNQGDPVSSVTNVDVTNPSTWPTATYPDYDAREDFRVSNLDIDGNGTVQLEFDAVLLFRRLAEKDVGMDIFGNGLPDGALGAGATRTDAAAIRAYVDAISDTVYDIDASGSPVLEMDGVLISRRLAEKDVGMDIFGAAFEDGAIDEINAERREPQELRDYIDLLFPD
ncbi:MAG: hypothetical protein GY795_09455 [Desulfobacterales bacterium]|nr:hypothetical protein [Desulfobacterales bacterium]